MSVQFKSAGPEWTHLKQRRRRKREPCGDRTYCRSGTCVIVTKATTYYFGHFPAYTSIIQLSTST